MSDGLQGLAVLVTGAGSGLGKAFARSFRRDGATVVGCDIANLDAAGEVTDLAIWCDVADPAQVEAMVHEAHASVGRIDALIANAGIGVRGRIEDVPWTDIEEVVRVNLFGVIHCARAVLPVMRRQGRGRIVNVCSRNAELCPPGLVGYNVSKAAVAAFTRTLAHELGDADILVNNVIPGPTATPLNPAGVRPPEQAYPTVRMLATLPTEGPSGRTFFDEREYPLFGLFVDGGSMPPQRAP